MRPCQVDSLTAVHVCDRRSEGQAERKASRLDGQMLVVSNNKFACSLPACMAEKETERGRERERERRERGYYVAIVIYKINNINNQMNLSIVGFIHCSCELVEGV